jgi:hypothetical protein
MRQLEASLEVRMIRHPLAETVSDQDDALSLRGGFRLGRKDGEGHESQGGQ